MRIFVAGGTGVIGRRAVPLMLQQGHQVTAVSRSPEKSALLERMGATPVHLDLFDVERVRSALRGHDIVVNVATSIPPSSKALMPGAWRETGRVRRYVSANLSAAAKRGGATRFIQESFAPIYASGGANWIDERSPIKLARYNRAIVDAEHAVADFTDNSGTGIALRFAYFYGPDSDFTLDAIKMVKKRWAPVIGSPDAFISSLSHDDAAAAVITALTAPAGVYNVGDDEPLTKRELYLSVANMLGVRAPRFLPSWLSRLTGSIGETLSRSQRISNRKLRALGWAPIYPSAREGWKAIVRADTTR